MPKKERQKADRVVSAFFAVVFLYAAISRAWIAFSLLVVLAVLVYLSFFRQTSCDVEVRSHPGGCGDTAYGWLGACHRRKHKRMKRRALLSLLNFSVSESEESPRWTRSPRGERQASPVPPPPRASEQVTRSGYDRVMLVATIIGSAASTLALVIGK